MASGRINGTCSGSQGSHYKFWIEWHSSVISGQAASYVSEKAWLQRIDSVSNSAWNRDVPGSSKKITLNGHTEYGSKGIDTRNHAKVLIASISNFKVNHDSNGYATVSMSASFPRVISTLTGGKISGRVSLDHIDRKRAVFKTLSIRATSPTEIETKWTSDVPIDRVEYSLNNSSWKAFDGKKITGLNPNTNYSVRLAIRKKSNQLFTISSPRNVKTPPILIKSIGLKQNIPIEVGQAIPIVTNIQPTNASIKKLTFETSDKNIFTVESGKLVAKKAGKAILTATTTDGSRISENSTVTCIQRVTGITVDNDVLNIPKGGAVVISYAVQPLDASDKAVTITTENNDIISISNNVVTGLENGTAEITITTKDRGFKATVTVNVIGDYVWYNYDKYIDVLNYWDVNNIYSNMQTIASILLANGYQLEPLHRIEARFDTAYVEVFDILQNMEYNLDELNKTDIESAFYIEPKKVGTNGENKADIFRWIQCLNDMYEIVNGNVGIWRILECTTDGIPTIDGKELIIRGDYFA